MIPVRLTTLVISYWWKEWLTAEANNRTVLSLIMAYITLSWSN